MRQYKDQCSRSSIGLQTSMDEVVNQDTLREKFFIEDEIITDDAIGPWVRMSRPQTIQSPVRPESPRSPLPAKVFLIKCSTSKPMPRIRRFNKTFTEPAPLEHHEKQPHISVPKYQHHEPVGSPIQEIIKKHFSTEKQTLLNFKFDTFDSFRTKLKLKFVNQQSPQQPLKRVCSQSELNSLAKKFYATQQSKYVFSRFSVK